MKMDGVTNSTPRSPDGDHEQPDRLTTVGYSLTVGLAGLASYWLTTTAMSGVHQSYEDGQLGGMWAAVATIFVLRDSRRKSLAAALSRMSATLVSFALCLAYLAVWPFHAWGLALLVGLSVLIPGLIGLPGDEMTAAITTTVVMVVAGLSPHSAWKQPILRLADTAIGVAVGIVAVVLSDAVSNWSLTGRRPRSGAQPTKNAR